MAFDWLNKDIEKEEAQFPVLMSLGECLDPIGSLVYKFIKKEYLCKNWRYYRRPK
jgi:hypothetical protein